MERLEAKRPELGQWPLWDFSAAAQYPSDLPLPTYFLTDTEQRQKLYFSFRHTTSLFSPLGSMGDSRSRRHRQEGHGHQQLLKRERRGDEDSDQHLTPSPLRPKIKFPRVPASLCPFS